MQKLYLKEREVMMVANGMSCYEVAGMLGHSPRTVESWVKDFNETGFSAPYDKERTGRPSTISSEAMKRIAANLRNDPHDSGYKQNM